MYTALHNRYIVADSSTAKLLDLKFKINYGPAGRVRGTYSSDTVTVKQLCYKLNGVIFHTLYSCQKGCNY